MFQDAILLVRNKGLSIEGDHKALVPFADLFRYQHDGSATWSYQDTEGKKGLVIEATTDLAQGDQIFFSYEGKPNQRLLSEYGFVDPENPNTKLPAFTLRLKKKDALLDLKKQKLGASKVGISLYHDFSNDVMQHALATLRVVHFDDIENADLLRAESKISYPQDSIGPLSSQNELRAILELQKLVRDKLHGYVRTMQGDAEALNTDSLSYNE